MNADGVSLPTTISQLGSVAKTQSRAQQQTQNVTPFKDQLDRREDLHVKRVKPVEGAEHRRIEAQDEAPDKRQRRRLRREQKALGRADDDDGPEAADEFAPAGDDPEEKEQVGSLIDLRA